MAEARREEEEEEGQTSDRAERTKPENLRSSQGPLSSVRAAIKRTRTVSQRDNKDRRRPQITIVAAEPLGSNSWFSGSSVGFPPPQPGSSTGRQPVSQVIKEKTQEEHTVKPTAAPRRSSCTTTSATQTDPVSQDPATAITQCDTPPLAEKRSAGKKPQKPPRPSLPKPADRKPVTKTDKKVVTNTAAFTNTEDQRDAKSDEKQLEQADSTCTQSVTVHWNIPINHLPVVPEPGETPPPNSDHSQRPVPRPRTKSHKQAIEEEAKVQTLVEISENFEDIQSSKQEVSSNKYLKELLEVFSSDNECEVSSATTDQSDEALLSEDAVGEMNGSNSQSNFRARIQAFESQAANEEGNVNDSTRLQLPARKPSIRPPVAAKPFVSLKPQFTPSIDDFSQNISATNILKNPTTPPRPQPPEKPGGRSIKEELEALHSRGVQRSYSVMARGSQVYEEEPSFFPPKPPVKPIKEPLKPNLNINNHNSASMVRDKEYAESLINSVPVKPLRNVNSNGGSAIGPVIAKRPTIIRVPSQTGSNYFQDDVPPLPVQMPVGSLNGLQNHRKSLQSSLSLQEPFSAAPVPSLPPRKPSMNKTLPPRPPAAKTAPVRPPQSFKATGRSQSLSWETSPKPQPQKPHRKELVFPPRPSPGHRLYNKYTLQLPHGIASCDYNGSNSGELSFQKNEVLLLLKQINHNEFECQAGQTRGRVHKSRMQIITPLSSDMFPSQDADPASGNSYGLKVQAVHDFNPEGPGELSLRAGDIVTMVEKLDSEWYRGTCRGSTGFFPINYVKVLSDSPKPLPERKPRPPPAKASGPRCVARFDFEGEQSDELSFSEGDVIQLKEYMGQDWARGQIGTHEGIFPLNFVEVIEDLPPPPSQQQSAKMALPGMVAASPSIHPEAASPAQVSQSSVEWVVALYDYNGKTADDLSFREGECILITQHLDDDWSCGRLNGKEGIFPRKYVESSTGQQPSNGQQNGAAGGGRARALYSYTTNCDEELSLQVGDIITNLESIDDEWFLGDLRGKRALVPKNYVQVLD
ncbi:SH3 domain-containing protein 19 isoform X2 [Archocentrus centrarchus]|uniref:SH3 domain-containing protein 19 isoform X2 n=1 Tax=Archocentrus centrarchus TaxID=63155 RepID=UPI0011EA06A1|nr:SH3 domain-containing protein 19 isoform X2 [Archocentrus centrarchus]